MMYSKGFVVAIRDEKGKVLRESKNKEVFLPFYSNYSIRLKNNNNKAAVAKIKIDGTFILGIERIIIPANSTVDIERFCINGKLSQGRKLQFVPLTDSRVQDPTDNQNGNIQVKFWLEKEKHVILNPRGSNEDWKLYQPHSTPFVYPDKPLGTLCNTSSILRSNNINFENSTNSDYSKFDIGATVEGDISNQLFSEGYIGQLESIFTKIYLNIKPSESSITVNNTKILYCGECGTRNRRKNKFCTNCGKKIQL